MSYSSIKLFKKLTLSTFQKKVSYFLGRSTTISGTETEETKTDVQSISCKMW